VVEFPPLSSDSARREISGETRDARSPAEISARGFSLKNLSIEGTAENIASFYCAFSLPEVSSVCLEEDDFEDFASLEVPMRNSPTSDEVARELIPLLRTFSENERRFLRFLFDDSAAFSKAVEAARLSPFRALEVQNSVRRCVANSLARHDKSGESFDVFIANLQNGNLPLSIESLELFATGPCFMELVFESKEPVLMEFRSRCFWDDPPENSPGSAFEAMGERSKAAYAAYLYRRSPHLSMVVDSPTTLCIFGVRQFASEVSSEGGSSFKEVLLKKLVSLGVFSGSILEDFSAGRTSARGEAVKDYLQRAIVGEALYRENYCGAEAIRAERMLSAKAMSQDVPQRACFFLLEQLRSSEVLPPPIEFTLRYLPELRKEFLKTVRKQIAAASSEDAHYVGKCRALLTLKNHRAFERYCTSGRPSLVSASAQPVLPRSERGSEEAANRCLSAMLELVSRAALGHVSDEALAAVLVEPEAFEVLLSDRSQAVRAFRERIFREQGGFHLERLGENVRLAFGVYLRRKHPHIDDITPCEALAQILGHKKEWNDVDRVAWRIAKSALALGVYRAEAEVGYPLARGSDIGFLLTRKVVGDKQFEENRVIVLSAMFPTLDHAFRRESCSTVTKAVKSVLGLPPDATVHQVCAQLVDLGITSPIIPVNHQFPPRHMSNYFFEECVGFLSFYNLGQHIRDHYGTIDRLAQVGPTLGTPLGVGRRTLDIIKEVLRRGYLSAEVPVGQAPGASNCGTTSTYFFDEEAIGREQVIRNIQRYLQLTLSHVGELKNETKGARTLRELCERYLGLASYAEIAAYAIAQGLQSPKLPPGYLPKSNADLFLDASAVGTEWASLNRAEWQRRRAA
jgi:hypothetical protein